MTRRRMSWLGLLLLPGVVFLFGAGTIPEATPEELIRQANAAFLRGDTDEADDLYTKAEERTADPGLVSFNRAAVLFQNQKYARAAELYYLVLTDAACPPDRAAKAWYNRGTCLLRLPNATTAMYRSAIACLERCINSSAADEPLKADARYNLELAKALWNEARKKENKPNSPNKDLPPEDPRNPEPPRSFGNDAQGGNLEQGDGNTTGAQMPKNILQPATGTGAQPNAAQAPARGAAGHLQPLPDDSKVQPLTPEETREYLRRTAERLKRDRQNLLRTLYGPDRPGILDW